MSQAERFRLHDGLDLDQLRRAPHLVEHRFLAAGLQRALQHQVLDEVRDDAVLALGGDDHQAVGAGLGRLGGDQLDAGGVDDRQQLLGNRFRRGQEAGTKTGGGHDRRVWDHHFLGLTLFTR